MLTRAPREGQTQLQSTVQRTFILVALVQIEKREGKTKHTPGDRARGLDTRLLVVSVTFIWPPDPGLTRGN